ncbi:MAG: alpha/beta hydrolase [Actinomycetota bacterium]
MSDATTTRSTADQPGTPRGCGRIAYAVGFQENATYSDVYGGGGAVVGLDCHLLRPVDRPSDTLLVFMHPVGGGMYLPAVRALAAAGHHVLWANSRYRGADYALIMEKVAKDLGEAIVDAKGRLGYEKIVLVGWSGGGSLSMWYQSLAEAGAGLRNTAAGDPYEVAADRMPAADAVIMMAAHVSRHQILTEWLDPSIHDESQPHVRDRELNLYDPTNPNQPPYGTDFLAAFAAAQVARNRRITTWVREKLAEIRASDNPMAEFAFTVHGTMADPRWLDGTIEPSDRAIGSCYLGDPEVVNDGPVGLARFSTLRSWLSQWSYDDARCDAVAAGPGVSVPLLVVGNSADDACTPSHTQRLFDAVPHDRKRLHVVQGATHYYTGPDGRAHQKEAVAVVGEFVAELGLGPAE